jgi:Ca2+-binding RTX toxin-like protein
VLTRHGCLGVALLVSAVAWLILAPTSFAGVVVTNQTVAKSGTVVTWTGGAANDGTDPTADVTSMTEPATGTITIATTSGVIDIISSTDADADCDYDNPEHTSVTCSNTTQASGNAGSGDDTVDASGLTSIPVNGLNGGNGNDTLTGGAGNDDITGGNNDDTINGGDGDDNLHGASGNDTVNGGNGNDDEVAGGTGNDVVNGGDGNDYMRGGPDADTMNGGAGDDDMNGACDGGCDSDVGVDDDTMSGDAGDDEMYGEDGNDTLNGGDDSDYEDGGDGNDHVNGNAGDDSNSCMFCKFGTAGTSAHADLVIGSNGGLYGGAGDDVIDGGDGNDYANGGDDNDSVSGGPGDDVTIEGIFFFASGGVYGGNGNDTVSGGDGTDFVSGDAGADVVNGDAGDDAYHYFNNLCPAGQASDGGCYEDIYGGVTGGADNDTVDGGDGIDTVNGDNNGIDSASIITGDDNVTGGAGDDAFHYNPDACTVSTTGNGGCNEYTYGGVWGDDGNDNVDGGDGRDYVNGSNGDDNVTGGPGDDTYHGYNEGYYADGSGTDPGVYGGDGNDTVRGGPGSDHVQGDWGQDNTDGEAGDDEVYEWDDGSPDVAHGGSGIDDLEYGSCCGPVNLTLNDQADDGEAAQPEQKDEGDANNNFASDLDNVVFWTDCFTACSNGTPVNPPSTIVGTSGANLLYGAAGNDDITGGDGADYMSGAQGDDTFHARDGYPDYIDCDAGVDTAIVDQFDTVHNCENVDLANVASAFDTSKPPVVGPQPPPAQPAQADTTPPNLTLTVSKTTLTPDQLVAGVKVSFSCNEDCALSLRLLAQQSSGRATFSRARGYNVVVGRRSVGFGKSKRNVKVRPCERKQGGPQSKACLKRFKKALNARLDKSGKVTMKLRSVVTDRAGNRATKIRTITIKRPRK